MHCIMQQNCFMEECIMKLFMRQNQPENE